jgi:toxin ParE1/3/4
VKSKPVTPRQRAGRDVDKTIDYYSENAVEAALDFIDALQQAYERSDHIDIWRVLHGKRHIPTWMQEPDML